MSSQATHLNSEDDDELQASPRKIKDQVHDLIEANDRLCEFIDTPQFQRLREIKQLGTSYYVWPGASHNRFEHSLGVAHLARTLSTKLRLKQPELGITDRDVQCVEIAALCHDLGHGPWSHLWDTMFIPAALPNETWTHEDASEMMLDYLIEDNGVIIAPEDTRFIKALIAGQPDRCPSEKQFFFDIVANKRNGLDVDKFDYFMRDSRMIGLGEKDSTTVNRLLDSARVIDDQICYNIKDVENVYDIFHTRFNLHKKIYNHKTGTAIEYMIIDALLLAEPILDIASRIHSPKRFIELTDNLLHSIEYSKDPQLAPSQAIIRRIRKRDLYKAVDYKLVSWPDREEFQEQVTAERIVAEAPADVIVSMAIMHWGMKDKNPTSNVMFYSNKRKNVCQPAGEGDHSSLMPAIFAEIMLRVYTKRPEFFSHVQEGYNAILPKIRRPSFDIGSSMSSIGSVKPVSRNKFTQVQDGYTPRKKRSAAGDDSPPSKRKRSALS
ncbi:HD-domain/PDEase-like protein [Hymenopellis radicata]|nr:HD-domain/PDEase-like protein [Hymenopellis radicata]